MQLSRKQRDILFFTVCIPLRTFLAFQGNVWWLRAPAMVIGMRWLGGLEVGNEGMFGGVAWWANARPLHGAFWASYALSGESTFLKLDTLFGVANFFANSI